MEVATNAATYLMAIIVNIKSGRPAVSFRYAEYAMGLRSDDIEECTDYFLGSVLRPRPKTFLPFSQAAFAAYAPTASV